MSTFCRSSRSRIVSHVSFVQEKEFETTKARHRKKFERLLEAKKKQETLAKEALSEDQRDRWVINLSHTELNTNQKNVLAKGLNFAITPNHLPKEDFCGSSRESMEELRWRRDSEMKCWVHIGQLNVLSPTSRYKNNYGGV